VGVFILGAKGLSVPMTPNTHHLFMNEWTVGTGSDFASGDVGFTSSTLHLFNQNFIPGQRAKLQALYGLLGTPIE
jgi:hypothetical protein